MMECLTYDMYPVSTERGLRNLMKLLSWLLNIIYKISTRCPRGVVLIWLIISVVGFSLLPSLRISTDLISGVGKNNEVIKLTSENQKLFGEQDALILALEFPEPPGEARRPFIQGLADMLSDLPEIDRVIYRFLDPENPDTMKSLYRNFLLGMTHKDRVKISHKLTPSGLKGAVRRNQNRLFLAENPYLQNRIMDDPMEFSMIISESMKEKVGQVSLGDPYLFLASPDGATFLIHMTPSFPSSDVALSRGAVKKLSSVIPKRINELMEVIPGAKSKFDGLKWHLTGKVVFHSETDVLFDQEALMILIVSFVLVAGFLIFAYRSLIAMGVLMGPIICAIGSNYLVMYFTCPEINPVVVGTLGILFGLGADFGVHLWGRIREERVKGLEWSKSLSDAMQTSGPPVCIGAMTSVIAFSCLGYSDQPAMGQFGYVCATGVLLTLLSTLFLVPALCQISANKRPSFIPDMKVRFTILTWLFTRRPKLVVTISVITIVLGLVFSTQIKYEEDLFKVFMAKDIKSVEVAQMITRKFKSNFSQPTLLTFEAEDYDTGLAFQRRLDKILAKLRDESGLIGTTESISYLDTPEELKKQNVTFIKKLSEHFQDLRELFKTLLAQSDLSITASNNMLRSFDDIAHIFATISESKGNESPSENNKFKRDWYLAKVDGRYRFLTKLRYSSKVTSPSELKAADSVVANAVSQLPVKVSISGPRQSMEAILSTLVSELLRLGLYAACAVTVFLLLVFQRPYVVVLSLAPMLGAFFITLGIMGFLEIGIPFSIIGVAPLIFGLGIDNGIHVINRTFNEEKEPVIDVMQHMTRLLVVTSLTSVLGFLGMIMSRHYSLEFLGLSMVIGMTAALALTLLTLPAAILLFQKSSPVDIKED